METIKTIHRTPYSSLREIRKSKVNKLLTQEIDQRKNINTLSLGEQKELNSFYSDVLTDIYNIRNKHPLEKFVSEISHEESIDSELHDVGTRSRALKESYRDEKGINSNRIAWEDGTVQMEKKLSPEHRAKVVKWPEGVMSSQDYFKKDGLSGISPLWIKDYGNNLNILINQNKMSSMSNFLEGKNAKIPLDISSFESKLDDTLRKSDVIHQSRTSWEKEGIKSKETLYSRGLTEKIINWEKEGLRQREVFDKEGSFNFSHTIHNDSIESKTARFGDISIEKAVNYEKGSALWRYKGRDKLLEHSSLLSDEGNRFKYTRYEDNICNKLCVESEDGCKHVKMKELYDKNIRFDTFSDKSFQVDFKTPELQRNTVLRGNGAGMDLRKTSNSQESLSWLPECEVLSYSKKTPEGVNNSSYFYGNKVNMQFLSYPSGNSFQLIELPNGVMKKVYDYQNGTKEAVTWFDTGEQRRTVRYNDDTFLTDLLYGGTMQKQGIKYKDGTCYLYKNWGNGISQQCFCWPDKGMAHLSTEFEKDRFFENKTIYPDGSYNREIVNKDEKSSMMISSDPLLKNIRSGDLQEMLFDPGTIMKFFNDPFHNPFLTIDPQLWAHMLLIQSRYKNDMIKSMEKIQAINEKGLDTSAFLKVSFDISAE